MHVSVEAGLNKLRTTYIDILSFIGGIGTPGKVLYLVIRRFRHASVGSGSGKSVRATTKTPFVSSIKAGGTSSSGPSSAKIIPMARAHGDKHYWYFQTVKSEPTSRCSGLAPLHGGSSGASKFRTDAEEERMRAAGEKGRTMFNPQWERTEDEKKISKALRRLRQSRYCYSTNFKARNDGVVQKVHYVGNNIKSMHISVEASLKKLRTTYIDILYVHWWDWDTSIEEVMNGSIISSFRARFYTSVSPTRRHGWSLKRISMRATMERPRSSSIRAGGTSSDRSFEREIIPMARAHGLALAPWLVVGAGKFRTDAEEERMRAAGEKGRIIFNPQWERTEDEKKVSKALEKVAAEVGTKSLAAVAIAYVMAKVPYCFPIIGGRKVEHLTENLEALDISLSSEQIAYLEGAVPFNPGFPTDIIGDGTKANPLLGRSAHFAKQPILAPIPHTKD
ncbi:putative Aryl-alcohol dehydrogenase [Mycena sanguinolenta]|uniref:Putative Aryl-alcohol dehydrogenase n=1 Tax=Mycena sanguinolenta TaxID=230812 RepID=A0A8H6X5Y8_9AGAR|nr:putative Aryl-alcohol dehydrogenase [Mycena sanguinolenta]